MKNLFFVAVISFSGTFLSTNANAQTAVRDFKLGSISKSSQFIDDIEINQPKVNKTDVVRMPSMPAPLKKMYQVTKMASKTIEECLPLQFKYAQLLDTYVETISNLKLYKAIEEWWATRYVYGGTSKSGIDCSALTGTILKQAFDIILPRTAREQYQACEKVDQANLTEGDLVFFNTTGGVSHVGVYLENGYFLHSSVHRGVTISNLNESYYARKFIGGGRIIR